MLALVLSLVFMLLTFLRTWGDMGSAVFGGHVIESALSQPILGTRLGYRLVGFFGAVVLVHLTLGVTSWLLALASCRAWPNSRNGLRAWSCLWLLLLAGWILLANAAQYPGSALGTPYYSLARATYAGISTFALASIAIAAAMLLTLGRCALSSLSGMAFRHRAVLLGAMPVLILCGLALGAANSSASRSESTRPNVIIIGLDSLRTDYVQKHGADELAPKIDDFLAKSTVFSDALTPLARTFPAWVSIVSGRNPHTTGAVINLFPREKIHEGDTLPDLMRDAGYQTIYAIDDVRFSNLDTSYGFEQMITPPMGAADFLIGFFCDSPLPNLLVNTAVGRLLFPFAYGNRAVAETYDPDTFVDRLADEIKFDRRPTFLAVHLTLAHWPYTFAGEEPIRGGDTTRKTRARYDAAVGRLDRQFGDVIDLLQERGALDNAVLVVLSDHGESLGEAPTVLAASSSAGPEFGHGTDVFAAQQYHVVLAVREFGESAIGPSAARAVDAPVSLVDLAPTFADWLGLSPKQPFDGVSLMPVLTSDSRGLHGFDGRVRFIETEYTPAGFNVGEVPDASQLVDAAQTYHVDPDTDLLSIRPELLGQILDGRQFAAVQGKKMLAALPAVGGEGQYLVYVDGGGMPVWLADVPDPKTEPAAYRLWSALTNRFATVGLRPVVDPKGAAGPVGTGP